MIIYDVVTLIGHIMGDIYDECQDWFMELAGSTHDFYLPVLARVYFYRHTII